MRLEGEGSLRGAGSAGGERALRRGDLQVEG